MKILKSSWCKEEERRSPTHRFSSVFGFIALFSFSFLVVMFKLEFSVLLAAMRG